MRRPASGKVTAITTKEVTLEVTVPYALASRPINLGDTMMILGGYAAKPDFDMKFVDAEGAPLGKGTAAPARRRKFSRVVVRGKGFEHILDDGTDGDTYTYTSEYVKPETAADDAKRLYDRANRVRSVAPGFREDVEAIVRSVLMDLYGEVTVTLRGEPQS